MPKLPHGRRADDPPAERGWRRVIFRLSLAVKKHPVVVGLALSLLVLSIPAYMVMVQQSQLKQATGDLRKSTLALERAVEVNERLVTDTTANRKITVAAFCEAINVNARYQNKTTDELEELILQGARASRAFERLYRAYGLPPYRERLRQARRSARRLDKRRVPALDCERYLRDIEAEVERSRDPHRRRPR